MGPALTFTVQPNRIEQTDFSGGWAPDPPEAAIPENASSDVMNLLPDPGSGVPTLRKGFERLAASFQGPGSALHNHWLRHLNYMEVIDGAHRHRFLICIFMNGHDDTNNNVQVWAYELKNDIFKRIDDSGRAWNRANQEHWYAIIQGVYYGGTRSDPMYSWNPEFDGGDWDPAASVWNDDPSTGDWKTWVDDIDAGVNTNTEYGRDYAFKPRTKVFIGSKGYVNSRGIRYKAWEDGQHYSVGDRVSRHDAWGQSGSDNYWKSFRCTQGHKSDAGSFKPGDGSSDDDSHWEKIRLSNILDDDDDITEDWFFNPGAAQSRVGTFHGERLWLRRDDEDNHSRLQYSAPLRPERNQEIADLTFDPTDWAAVDDVDGDGGGWLDFRSGDGDAIRALLSFGNYLIVAKRWTTFVISGTNEQTWTVRVLGKGGALAPGSICEHEGLAYFLGPSGSLYVTDGTSMQEAPGTEKVRNFIKDKLDRLLLKIDDFNWQPNLVSYGRFIWITLPDDNAADRTLVYDPRTGSFWQTDIPMLDVTTGANYRAQRMWFSTAYTGEPGQPGIFQYLDDPGDEVYTDDDRDMAPGNINPELDITWRWKSPWYQFGATRNERRIRRTWALMKASRHMDVRIKGYRNFDTDTDLDLEGDDANYQKNRTADGRTGGEFVEGKTMPNSYSVSIKVAGDANDNVALLGLGIDTEPIRTRFHRGVGTYG